MTFREQARLKLREADVKILQQVDTALAALPEEARLKDVTRHLGSTAA